MLRLPVVFVGAAIGQVLFRKSSVLYNENKPIFPIVSKVIFLLVALSIIPFIIIGYFGPELFSFIFGERWEQSGLMAAIMIPWLMLNFIASPLSFLPILLGKQKAFFWVNLVGTSSMFLIVSIPYWGYFQLNFFDMLKLLSVSQTIVLSYNLIWLLWLARKADKKRGFITFSKE